MRVWPASDMTCLFSVVGLPRAAGCMQALGCRAVFIFLEKMQCNDENESDFSPISKNSRVFAHQFYFI